jgi:hypothetical protein
MHLSQKTYINISLVFFKLQINQKTKINKMKKLALLCLSTIISGLSFGQTVTTFAGKVNDVDPWTNFNNISSTAADAYFYEPQGMCWDNNGNMYFSDRNKIRILYNNKFENRTGKLGNGQFSQGYKDGTGIDGYLYNPTSIVSDANGNIYIVDSENHAIRKLSPFSNVGNGQSLSTVAGDAPPSGLGGTGTPDFKDATGTASRFNMPKGITIDKNGNFYITDYNNFRVRKMTPAGVVTTLAGTSTEGATDGNLGTNSTFAGPWGIAMFDDNNVIITDQYNACIRKVNILSGKTTTIAGKAGEAFHKDGTIAEARFVNPQGIAVVGGLIYVADRSTIRVIDITNGTVSTFAGNGSAQGNTNGDGTAARFGQLSGMVFDGNNSLYVTDIYYNLIKKVAINNLAPSADFTATQVSLMVNQEATVTDASGGKAATGRKWTVTNASSTTANVIIVSGDLNASSSITVKFSATGFYTVKLDVTNEFGNDSKTKNSFFNVSTTGSSVEEIKSQKGLMVYPNPASSEVYVNGEYFDLNNARVTITDLSGKTIKDYTGLNGLSKLDINNLAKGLYVLNLLQDNNLYHYKIQVK